MNILHPFDSVKLNPDGSRSIRGILLSDETPSSLSLTGADVEELNDNDVLEMGCILITPSTSYIAFEDGVFTAKE